MAKASKKATTKKAAAKKTAGKKGTGKNNKKVIEQKQSGETASPAVQIPDPAPVQKEKAAKRNTAKQSAGNNGLPSEFVRYWDVE